MLVRAQNQDYARDFADEDLMHLERLRNQEKPQKQGSPQSVAAFRGSSIQRQDRNASVV